MLLGIGGDDDGFGNAKKICLCKMNNSFSGLNSTNEVSNYLSSLLFRRTSLEHKVGDFDNLARAQEEVKTFFGEDHLKGIMACADII